MKRILLLFTAILAAGIMTFPIIGAAITTGDGYLLKRSPEETCHSCHKTNVNTPSPGQPGYGEANWNGAIKMHSAEMLGTCSDTTYKTRTACINAGKTWTAGEWNVVPYVGIGWGVSAGKYGEFLCTTCHTAHDTKNIYLIKQVITTPDGTNWGSSGESRTPANSVGNLDLRYKEAYDPANPKLGTLGRDNEARTSSDRVCEVCHTYNSVSASDGVTVHAYNMPATATPHKGTTTCTGCHPHKSAFAGTGCDGCHNSPPTVGEHTIHFGSGSVGYGSTTIQSIPAEYRFSCGICHNGTHPNTTENPRTVDVIFAGVAIQDPDTASDPATYTPAAFSVDDPLTGWTFNYSDGTCSNVYCHGNYPGSGNNASPTFTTGTAACGTCHGVYDAANTSYPASGSHEKHVTATDTIGYASNREYQCTLCHNGIVTGVTSYTISNKSKHVSGFVDWQFDTSDPRAFGGDYSYGTGTTAPSDGTRAYGTCSNVYCHSIVQTADGSALTGAEGEYIPPTWGSPSTCSCHDADAGEIFGHTPVEISSGSHAKHLTYTFNSSWAPDIKGTLCTICHKWNASATYDECNQCHQTTEEKTYHVNGNVDVVFDTYFGNGTYDGTPVPGDGYGTCNNVYCHSIVQTADGGALTGAEGEYIPPTWGSPSTCNCHDADAGGTFGHTPVEISSGSHAKHLSYTFNSSWAPDIKGTLCTICHKWNASATYDECDQCHISTEEKTYHVNRNVDVVFDTYWGNGTYDGTPVPGDGYGTCNNVYCHSIVQTADGGALTGAEGEYIPPTWGSPSTCNCHDADAGGTFGHTPVEISSGSHAKHLSYTFNSSWAPDIKGTLCTICHKWNASATYDECDQCHISTEEKTLHANHAINVSFDTYFGNGTYNGASDPGNGYSNCSNTYCHSNGTGGTTQPGETRSIADNTSANWGGSTTCESCHGVEVVGSSGRPSYANGSLKANSHSAHPAYTCNYCHVNTTIDGTTIDSKEYHVNRYYDVDADAGAGVSFTYTYIPTGGTCTSVSCHTVQPVDTTWGGGVP